MVSDAARPPQNLFRLGRHPLIAFCRLGRFRFVRNQWAHLIIVLPPPFDRHWFLDMAEAKATIEAWRQEYNRYRPHGALGDLTPLEFLQQAH
jgi:transposase InsO family protein